LGGEFKSPQKPKSASSPDLKKLSVWGPGNEGGRATFRLRAQNEQKVGKAPPHFNVRGRGKPVSGTG